MVDFPEGGAARVFRDFTTAGNPASQPNHPEKEDIRTLLGFYEGVLNTHEARLAIAEAASGDPAALAQLLSSMAATQAAAEAATEAIAAAAAVITEEEIVGTSFAVLDPETGGLTFMACRSDDGSPIDSAARLIVAALTRIGYDPSGPGFSISPDGNWKHPSGDMVPAEARRRVWAGWGSSSMVRYAPYLAALGAEVGATYYDGGGGGQMNNNILARMGIEPVQITFPSNTVPASGTVAVGSNISNDAMTIEGYLDTEPRIYGTLSGSGTSRTFTRSVSGLAVAVPVGVEMLPTTDYRDAVLFLMLGKNDLNSGRPLDDIVRGNRLAVDWAAPVFKRALVIGLQPQMDDMPGSSDWTLTMEVRAYEAARYGKFYVDVIGYLLSEKVWTDTGWAKSSQDLADIAAGKVPSSFFSDNLHMTPIVHAAITTHLIRPQLIELDWFNGALS